MTDQLKLKKNRTYNQVARGVRRVVYDVTPTKDLRAVYNMERKETLSQYGFTPMDIAEMLVKLDIKYNITLPIDTFPKYSELTLGKLIYETDHAIQHKKLQPKTSDDILYVFWQVLSAKGLPTHIINREKALKEYDVGPWFALSLIQELERQIGLNPAQISKEIEAKFNDSKSYDYYNEVSVNDIVRIANHQIQKNKAVSVSKNLSDVKTDILDSFMNEYNSILRI